MQPSKGPSGPALQSGVHASLEPLAAATLLNRLVLETNLKFVVQRTFLEVVEEDGNASSDSCKRVQSAPASKRRTSPESVSYLAAGAVMREVEGTGTSESEAVREEQKTTVVIRNLPLDCTRDSLVAILDAEGFAGKYDFLYLPIEFTSGANFGYVFVNFTGPQHASYFLSHFQGFSHWSPPCDNEAVVGWSWTQGLVEHIERYRNSPVMHESMLDECKPIVMCDGVRVEFPPPTKKVQMLRRLRTRCGSRGRGVPSSGPGSIGNGRLKAARALPEAAPLAQNQESLLLPGLSWAPAGAAYGSAPTDEESSPITSSPLLAGLRRGDEAQHQGDRPPIARKALQPEQTESDVHSECSTEAPSSFGFISSSGHSDGTTPSGAAGSARRSAGPGLPWAASLLSQGLVAHPVGSAESTPSAKSSGDCGVPEPGCLIEVVGTYPSGEQAVIMGVDHAEGTFKIQLLRNGRATRSVRTIKAKHARLLQRA